MPPVSHSGSSRWREPLPSGGWDRATLALFLVAGLLVAATFRDYGSTWDERVQEEVGRDAIAWFASGGRDHLALSGGSGGDLHLYGGMFEVTAVLAARVLPFDPVETRHLLNALVALAGVAGAALLSRRLGGPRAAFFGAALLLTTPPWWGHGFANSKDIPFAAAYAWLLLALLRVADELPRPGLRRTLVAGAALGLGLAVRPGGLVLLLPLAAGVLGVRLLPVLRRSASLGRLRGVVSAGSRLIAIAGLGWAGMLALWPYGLTLPLSGPIAAVTAARSFHWNGLVRYAGGWHASTDLPRGYAPGWLLATMPETWLVIAVAGAAAGAVAWRRDRVLPALEVPWLDRGLVAAAGFGPILAAVATRPVLYDGVRHFLFVLPALAALSGWVLSAALHRLPRRGGRAVIAATAGFAALAVSDAIRLHPYQYVYFNRAVAGGLRRASFDYELDYWGATGREAIGWVARNVSPRGGRPLLVATTADPSVASHWIEGDLELRSRFVFDAPGPPDLRLATTRWFEHRATGRVLHVVKRMGVPLLYVIDPGPGAGGPLVLEGGDLAVALPPAVGWTGVAVPRPGDERAVYELRRVIGVGARAEVVVLTPRSGRVPSLEQLRAEVALAAESLGIRQGEVAPQPVVGPVARGWVVTSGDTAEEGAPSIAVAAARVGEGAILLRAQYDRDPQGSSRELVEWIRGASLAKEEERRRP
jgi:hypothetical protein